MMTLAYWLVVVWFAGFAFFAARALNFTRLVLNNLAPETNYWDSVNNRSFDPVLGGFIRIDAMSVDPERLTEAGKKYRALAIRNSRLMFAWALIGFIGIASLFAYAKSLAQG